MTDRESATQPSESVEYRTRWGRASIAIGTAFLLVFGMAYSMATGAFGSTYVATTSRGQLAADGLTTDHVAAIVRKVPVKNVDGSIYDEYVASFLIGTGQANGICLTEKASLLGQTVTLLIEAGDDDPSTDEIQVNGLVLNVFDANAFLQAQGNTYVNKNPLDIVIDGAPTAPGSGTSEFGLEAQGVVLQRATATVQDGELVEVPPGISLKAQMLMGDYECPPPG
ncbi:hypothetical protein [Antrihabitans sp. YC2-6]|uniref:hypothetical protein n=1 Tax=Antrihabitans sp. YC2-6 TaxID=2799498 RepID=UPI0018F5071E|nr:hypothetical protein [Antrihabitans sp. YC2-6]MBJ8348441.1 hypothetical protein [Antrihabitans sp. YC2-6]